MWTLKCSTGDDPRLTSLNGFKGRQIWVYDEKAGSKSDRAKVEQAREYFTKHRFEHKHSSDELMRLQRQRENSKSPLPSFAPPPKTDLTTSTEPVSKGGLSNALTRGVGFFSSIQDEEGFWPSDYGGPMFLMPGLVITLYITGKLEEVLSAQHRREMVRYLHNHQNEDGGYGLHIEGHSTMFGTVLSYVTLRLLGEGPDTAPNLSAREWMGQRGGAIGIPSWGKFWLSALGVHSWDGINPMPPEMWLLPYKYNPVHPGRYWCHCRMVYLPMSYVYGVRGTAAPSALTAALKEELYTQPYESIDWNQARNACAKEDLYYKHPLIQDLLWWGCYKLEPFLVGSRLRKWALREVMDHVHYEDVNTRYVDIGPVNKVVNMLCCWLEDPASSAFQRHLPRVLDYLWVAEDGMKMQGYNGSQLWDCTFAVQALASTRLADDRLTACLRKAHAYVEASQVREDAPEMTKYYRHISKGAWPFSSRDHGWPITDCSSEGLKASLILREMPAAAVGAPLEDERFFDAVNVVLSYQNPAGGFATYENTRGSAWLELLNPAETFGDIMIDYSYVECSSACLTALAAFRAKFPQHRPREVHSAIARGREFLVSIQRPDGSWYGSWGVCFTYAAWFGMDGLVACGDRPEHSPPIQKCCRFLLQHQRADGGWAESYLSSQDKVYSHVPEHEESHAVQTAWALLALVKGGQAAVDPAPLHAAARCLVRLQQPSGDWPQQRITGVFNRNCMITYANYRNIFPLWALGEYRSEVLGDHAPGL